MAYVTQSEIEAYTGYGSADFKQGASQMTSEQWTTFVTLLIDGVEQAIHRFCNVSSFAVTEYTEVHDGRGRTKGTAGRMLEYNEHGRTFLPINQPVTVVSSVYEDTTYPDQITWTLRTERSAEGAGDYLVFERGAVTGIRFTNNVPRKGIGNVRITYSAGYAISSPVLDDIKLICLEAIANQLARKKRDQETQAARRTSTQDAANMIQIAHPETLLTKELKERLRRYRRLRTGFKAWR